MLSPVERHSDPVVICHPWAVFVSDMLPLVLNMLPLNA